MYVARIYNCALPTSRQFNASTTATTKQTWERAELPRGGVVG